MKVLVDTSAFYALASSTDEFHTESKRIYETLLRSDSDLVTSSYVLLETIALIHRRLGIDIVVDFINAIEGIIEIIWVTEDIHRRAWSEMSSSMRETVSLVDFASFVIIQDMHIERVFAFDEHFREKGCI